MSGIALRIAALGAFLFAALGAARSQAPILTIEALGKGAAPLDGPWQFHIGDNAAWANPAADDTTGPTSTDKNGWEQLTADQPWGAQGHPSYAGYAWYRKHLHLIPAAGATPDFALLIPSIDDTYEVYWNGRLVGRWGALPPHAVYYYKPPQQTFGLGPARDGVLALRVWKEPLDSFDPAEIGGFEATPLIGSPEAIAGAKAEDDYSWMRGNQFRFALWSLYCLVAIVGFFVWLRSRGQPELLALAVYCAAITSVNLDNLRLLEPYTLIIGWEVIWFGLENVSLWSLLLYLFNLDKSPQGGSSRTALITRILATITLTVCVLDTIVSVNWNNPIFVPWAQAADGILTAIFVLMFPFSLVLVGLGILGPGRKGQLDASRWFLAVAAALDGVLQNAITAFDQGRRFTHWHVDDKLRAPLFTLNGNSFAPRTLTGILLFAAIVYAVYRTVREAMVRQTAVERELQSARELQQVLIPEALPKLEGYDLSSAYIPAQEVGGDFFQVIPLENNNPDGKHAGAAASGSALIVLGDVSGKGLRAAMAVSLLVGALRTLAESSSSPAEILAGLNRRLYGRLQGGFATCIVLRVDKDGRFVVANAGHLAPLVNGRGSEVRELDLPGALPLGLLPAASYEEREFRLQPGERLTVLSDGVVEAQNAGGELFGFARTAQVSTGNADQIARAAQEFGQQDDITVLTLVPA
jgi:serine phosphatase RsbU (regulator of sigma subunit)